MKIVIILSLFFLSGAFNGLMDGLQFHGACKHFDNSGFWCPNQSWANKWTLNEAGNPVPGMERFWGSSTVFVFVTDGWHLSKFFRVLFLKLAVVLAIFWKFPGSPKLPGLYNGQGGLVWLLILFVEVTVAQAAGFWLVYNVWLQ